MKVRTYDIVNSGPRNRFCVRGRIVHNSGKGPQPQNLPNSGPPVRRCDPINGCGKHYGAHLDACPWCSSPGFASDSAEWGIEPATDALAVISYRELRHVETVFGDATAVVSGCLRGLFSAPPGREIICSDYSAIEAVVLAALAGEEWRLEVFRTHGKIYEMSAAKISGIPFEEFKRHKEETGDHHPMRKKVGKVAELACFAPDTQVLTKRGYVPIMGVTENDLLWDGVEWVSSYGAINKGPRKTINVDGVKVTKQHPISLGHSWTAAEKLALNENTLRRALAIGSANLPSLETRSTKAPTGLWLNALADSGRTSLATLTSTLGSLPAAPLADAVKAAIRTLRNSLSTPKLCPTTNIGVDFVTDLAPLSVDATMLKTVDMETTVVAVSPFVTSGVSLSGRFLSMLKRSKAGTTLRSKWTGLKPTETTNPVISDSLQNQKTGKINGLSSSYKKESTNSNDVYDIVNAGPRNRFTIKTDSGHLIVHNSGYQGGYGAWLAFGADKHLNEEEIRAAIKAWRKESPAIVNFWYDLERAAIAAVMYPGNCYSVRGLMFGVKDDVLYCQLLSGRKLCYHRPRLHDDVTPWGKPVKKLTYEGFNSDYKKGPRGWLRMDTYGGKLCENVVQATARDILTHALVKLERAGYEIVLHVHDEPAAEVPAGWGSVEEFERIMVDLPDWAADWPIRAAGGWRGRRYRKD